MCLKLSHMENIKAHIRNMGFSKKNILFVISPRRTECSPVLLFKFLFRVHQSDVRSVMPSNNCATLYVGVAKQ